MTKLNPNPTHYYGDVVRIMFLGAAFLMIVGLPYFAQQGLIPVPINMAIVVIVTLGFLAGLINPRQTYTIIVDFAVSLLGVLIFEYLAITNYVDQESAFFLSNQCLAVLFFVALYYSTKTLRGHYVPKT